MEVNHAIKETGLSFNTDAVLAVPTKTSEVRLFALGNGSMSRPCLAKEVWDCERYAGHRVLQGACGTIGRTYPFWQRRRYTRSKTFLRLHVVLAGRAEHLLDNRLQALTAAVQGITFEVWATTLPDFSAASSGTRSASTTRTGAASATPKPSAADRSWASPRGAWASRPEHRLAHLVGARWQCGVGHGPPEASQRGRG
ncbi:hypothetical protein ACFXA3_09305 [Streptomyces sp. NPDC059456]|uniref:hypothetical protein n=1 Tax=Streptomyces sp. NPDC059456 TaxID=3346838 RepID=UPI0036970885